MPSSAGLGVPLTIEQLEALWISQGGSPDTAPVAASVAMAESSGRRDAVSPNPDGGQNVGVWQLDTKGKGAGYTISQLQDPATNARAAVKGSANGQDWGAWSTFTTGRYTPFLPQAQSSVSTVQKDLKSILKGIETGIHIVAPVTDLPGVIGQVLQLPGQIIDFLTVLEQPVKAMMWLVNPANWARIMAGIIGFFLLGAGLITLGMAA